MEKKELVKNRTDGEIEDKNRQESGDAGRQRFNLETDPAPSLKEYALRTMSEGVLIISEKGMISYINPYGEQILGVKVSANVFFRNILLNENHKNDELIDLIADVITGEKNSDEILRKNRIIHYYNQRNEEYYLDVSCSRISRSAFVLTFSNQTQLIRENQKRIDSTAVLTSFFLIGCIWTVGVSVWMRTGETFPVGYLTIIMEVLGILALGLLLKLTSFTLQDFGLSLKNIVPTLKRTLGRVLLLLSVFCIAKFIIRAVRPGSISPDKSFWDWGEADFRLIKYMVTAFVQEFLARGGVQTALASVFEGKHGRTIAIYITSLYFAALHFQYGLPMMFGAGILSILLGYLYKKDGNIYGVTIIHYCFGKFADFLHFL